MIYWIYVLSLIINPYHCLSLFPICFVTAHNLNMQFWIELELY